MKPTLVFLCLLLIGPCRCGFAASSPAAALKPGDTILCYGNR